MRAGPCSAAGRTERDPLRSARDVLAAEVALCLDVPEDEARALLEDVALTGTGMNLTAARDLARRRADRHAPRTTYAVRR